MKTSKIIISTMAMCCAMLFASTSCRYFIKNEGKVRVSSGGSGGTVGLGFIENRDIRFTPHAAGNFRNMLEFELSRSGYRVQELDYRVLSGGGGGLPAKTKAGSKDNDLLPKNLRNVAGESGAGYNVRARPWERPLNSAEIKAMAQANGLRYLVQGAVGRSETGPLLESQEATLVFLSIFDASGNKVGLINFSVQGRDLGEAPFLRTVCERIAQAFRSGISGGSSPAATKKSSDKDL